MLDEEWDAKVLRQSVRCVLERRDVFQLDNSSSDLLDQKVDPHHVVLYVLSASGERGSQRDEAHIIHP